MTDLSLTIPLVPPSVNHYKVRARNGHYFVTPESKAFKDAVAIIAQGRKVEGKRLQLDIGIYMAAKQRGDLDNFAKLCGDSLQAAGVIRNDNDVMVLRMEKHRDADNPRTEIRVRAL